MKCVDCCYYWKSENDTYPCCHYPSNDGYAPCEVEECEGYEEPDYDRYDEIEQERIEKENAYYSNLEELDKERIKEYEVSAVGRYTDALPIMREIISAKDPVSARVAFNEKHPEYRAIGCYKIDN